MFAFIFSRVSGALLAFVYPGYASFKALNQRPASEADLERWLTYWSVLGCLVFVEYAAAWALQVIPFYNQLRTLFLFYLVLPQTQGSKPLYGAHVAPFLHAHEARIDAFLGSLKARILAFLQARLRLGWDSLSSATSEPATAPAAPTMSDPVSGPTMMLGGMWRAYGPAILAGGAALLSQQQAQAQAGFATPPGGPSRVASSADAGAGAGQGYDAGGDSEGEE